MLLEHRRKMTLLDAILLVGSAAVGLGLFELSHRTLFKGQIWLVDQGLPDTPGHERRLSGSLKTDYHARGLGAKVSGRRGVHVRRTGRVGDMDCAVYEPSMAKTG
jgi:hypothetical protein